MNVERIFHWVRLVAGLILEVFPQPPEVGEEAVFGPGPAPNMKPERIQFWLRIVARAALEALDGVGAGSASKMKPERIQFWLELIARFVLAVVAGANGETGKSGDPNN